MRWFVWFASLDIIVSNIEFSLDKRFVLVINCFSVWLFVPPVELHCLRICKNRVDFKRFVIGLVLSLLSSIVLLLLLLLLLLVSTPSIKVSENNLTKVLISLPSNARLPGRRRGHKLI